ncbi:hypothetical protein [Streptantibioticus silvisoli]|uniref:Uncharacterized protein n=1 Tax=Streptantibioticus silvisoli TaxID=2705255 RepID=A0ABT6W2B9_9ACTN|nr:hypothetical protein [Streptantibioticus silvisoli]MDI5964824.1 hypothetical protein [Streptantibioticus silvisoli]
MTETALASSIASFAAMVVDRAERHATLVDEGPDEQRIRVAQRITDFAKTTPLTPVYDTVIDLAGFGQARIHFRSEWDDYLLLAEGAESLGWPNHKAVAWARRQYLHAVEDQRELDEERGDGLLGYECMRDYLDLRIDAIIDDPEAKPDGGQQHSAAGDWLISRDRVFVMLLDSPWGKEFMSNVKPAMTHAVLGIWGDKLTEIPAVDLNGMPLGNVRDVLLDTHGMTKDEAMRRARRGPVVDGHFEDSGN